MDVALLHQLPGNPGNPASKVARQAAGRQLGQAPQVYQPPQSFGPLLNERLPLGMADDGGEPQGLQVETDILQGGGMEKWGNSNKRYRFPSLTVSTRSSANRRKVSALKGTSQPGRISRAMPSAANLSLNLSRCSRMTLFSLMASRSPDLCLKRCGGWPLLPGCRPPRPVWPSPGPPPGPRRHHLSPAGYGSGYRSWLCRLGNQGLKCQYCGVAGSGAPARTEEGAGQGAARRVLGRKGRKIQREPHQVLQAMSCSQTINRKLI